MPIRAERPHVGTDPVSVRIPNSIYLPHNILLPIRPGVLSCPTGWADRHGVCPYTRVNARVGILYFELSTASANLYY